MLNALKAVWLFVLPLVRVFAVKAGTDVLDIAADAVRRIAATMGEANGEEKRKAAIEAAKAELTRRGREVSDNVLNLAIETAYARLKKAIGG